MITVGRLAPGDQFDQHMLDELFANTLYPTGLEFDRVEGYPDAAGCVLLTPGRYWFKDIGRINEAVSRYDWLLLIKTGDEEDLFDLAEIEHPNVRFWCQTPRTDRDYGGARLIPLGYPPYFSQLPAVAEKSLEVFISAQATHHRRHECFDALSRVDAVKVVEETAGFTQGMSPSDYVAHMVAAKVAPCPSGAVSPDSFRAYEALESHCVPILDDVSPTYDSRGYWERMFPGSPLPILTDYESLPGYIEDLLADWPRNSNRVAAWWLQTKRRIALNLRDDLQTLGAL